MKSNDTIEHKIAKSQIK